jgi:hypothetical protein
MTNTLWRLFVWLSLFVGIAACQVPLPTATARAVLEVSGPNVFVNGHRATSGMTLRRGDRVTTGAASSARARFSGGTSIQLGADTDPIFEWIEHAVTVTVESGWLLIKKGSDSSVEVFNQLADVVYYSEGVVHAEPGRFTAYLFSGALVPRRPPARQLQPLEFLEVVPDAAPQIGRIDPGQAARLRAMFDHFEFIQDIQMPSLKQMDLRAATRKLASIGLKRGRVEEEPRNDMPDGFVLRQSIPPGTFVTEGTVVDLVIARRIEPAPVRVPNVEKMRLEDAIATLESRGLNVGRIKGPRQGVRLVVRQSPSAGKRVPEGSRINLEVVETTQDIVE